MSFELKIDLLEDEYWYGGCCDDGVKMPFGKESDFHRDINIDFSTNQTCPFLVSSKGRYLWCESGFEFWFKDGVFTVVSNKSEPKLYEGFGTLKGAFLAASKAHFVPSGKYPDLRFFSVPQYNTWIEYVYNQSEENVLKYAKNLIENGYPAGVIMIDDNWHIRYGKLEFNHTAFPHPKEMIQKLHDMGFSVMLWTCPFVCADNVEFRELQEKGLLVKDKDGKVAVREWWSGYSAELDVSNPAALEWFKAQLDILVNEYGVDGFKFDAGDAYFYKDDDINFGNLDANGMSEAWAKFGEQYKFNEYRACFKCGGRPLVQRLRDKEHSWGSNGIASLVPDALAQSIIGHPFVCPDMIGGGLSSSFWEQIDSLDFELFVRYAQTAALMPMMQYSAAPWRVLDKEHAELCLKSAKIHTDFAPIIEQEVKKSATTGEPIIRYLEYVFPNENLAEITDQFMLGDTVLVAPVGKKGEFKRNVVLPKGNWTAQDGTVYEGGKAVSVNAPLDTLPIFILQK